MLFVSLSSSFFLNDLKDVDGVELRLDLFEWWDQDLIKQILDRIDIPVMLTLRKASHGGRFKESEKERESKIINLLTLKPAFFDLECDMRVGFLNETIQSYPDTKFILSYHNFDKTPDDIDSIYNSMLQIPAYGYKMAAFANSTNDALRMLLLSKKHPNLSAICMGEKGAFARVLGPVVRNLIDYACVDLDEKTAPGQLSVSELLNVYRYRTLNHETRLYGLIGDPIEQSRGHLYHNDVFSNSALNAVYVKMSVKVDELTSFFGLALELGFEGMSVTMPLKEVVLFYIEERDEHVANCKAANTLRFYQGKMSSTNTDGRGALDAIEKKRSVRNQVFVLLGAGGAARSIAYEAKRRGAKVWILNRTLSRAKKLAEDLDCIGASLSQFPPHYDILVNCSPETISLTEDHILSDALVMDIIYVSKETAFLKVALQKGCEIVYGEEMFFAQAALQTKFWLSKNGPYLNLPLSNQSDD